MKKLFGLMVLVLALCMMGTAGADECQHEFALRDCTYERQCSICETVFPGNTAHSWGSWQSGTGSSHTRECTNYQCEAVDGGYHHGGTATCTDKAVCMGCGLPYGDIDPDAHDWGEWNSTGKQKLDGHSHRCKRNNSHYERKEHTGGNPTCSESVTCDVCDATYLDGNNHAGYGTTDWGTYDNTKHVKLCEGCKYVVDRATHTFDNDADPKCDACGYTREVQHTHDWGEWQPSHDINHPHTRACQSDGCNETETKEHDFAWVNVGGGHDWRCQSDHCSAIDEAKSGYHVPEEQVCHATTCTVCGLAIGGPADHTWSDWYSVDEIGHRCKCLVEECGAESIRYAHEFTVAATCTTPAKCGKCGYLTGDVDKSNHGDGTEIRNQVDAGEFTEGYTGDTYCLGCGDKLADGQTIPATHIHSYAAATCTTPATCSCNATTGEALGHAPGPKATCTNDQVCTRSGCGVVLKNKLGHAPGTAATCTTDQVCTRTGCGVVLKEKLGHAPGAEADCTNDQVCTRSGCGVVLKNKLGHAPGAEADCTNDQVCTRTGCGTVLKEKLGHIPGAEATCTTDQVCTRTGCGVVLNEKLGHTEVIDPAVAPTCTATGLTEGNHCSVCLAVLIAQDVIPANGHSYEAETVVPTCTKGGYTNHTCTVCGDTYIDSETNAREHWYDLWYPNLDSTHSAECKRNGCNYVETTECTLFEITVKDAETETSLTVCPVCGDHEETPFVEILEAVIKEIDKYAIPRGELIVRGMDAPFDDVLYAFTAAYEFAGNVASFNGIVSVTIPLDAEKYTEFKLVRVDVTPATETMQRTEVWTDIAFTYEDGKLIFKTATAGLFLLIPQQ